MTYFKKGDRVRVYDLQLLNYCMSRSAKGTVASAETLNHLVVKMDERKTEEDQWIVHPKQCRKLVRKPRVRVWLPVKVEACDVEAFEEQVWRWLTESPEPDYMYLHREFVEVKPKKQQGEK